MSFGEFDGGSFGYLPHIPTVDDFAKNRHIELCERFLSGHSGADVYRGVMFGGNDNSKPKRVVVKYATSGIALPGSIEYEIYGKSVEEIKRNIEGYRSIKRDGIERILPDIMELYSQGSVAAIVMEDLGDSFYETSIKNTSPADMYRLVANDVVELSRLTRKEDNEAEKMLSVVKSKLVDVSKTLRMFSMVDDYHLALIHGLDIKRLAPKCSSFGPYDFTPEDVFLVNGQIKYPDPKGDVRGCPFISLAAFAGVSLDSYNLPGSVDGYDFIRFNSVKSLAQALQISSPRAVALFDFGRAMQLAFSAYYRHQLHITQGRGTMDKSRELARMSTEHLEKVEVFLADKSLKVDNVK